jgi:hypothetical protein
MPQAQATEQTATRREVVFDENGQTVEVVEAPEEGSAPIEETADPVAEAAREAAAPAAKFRIGDQEFATADEALAYAQSQVSTLGTEIQVADAYRQGIRDAIANPGGTAPGVTQVTPPPAPVLNTEELYTNPQEFLRKYGDNIKAEVLSTTQQQQSMKQQSDAIWSEFAARHPEMSEFRNEVEAYVQGDQATVRSVIQTKGRPASYDFIATKLKSRFEAYANAVKPKRELANTTTTTTPNAKGTSVTPPTAAKKALSFSEQIRSIRKRT